MVTRGVGFECGKVVRFRDEGLGFLGGVEEIGHGGEGHGGGVGPSRTVPLAFVACVSKSKFRVALFRSGQTEWCMKSLRVDELFPRIREFWRGEMKIPWGEPVEFADLNEVGLFASGENLEKASISIPEA